MKLLDPISLLYQNPFSYWFFIPNNRFMPTFWKYCFHLNNPHNRLLCVIHIKSCLFNANDSSQSKEIHECLFVKQFKLNLLSNILVKLNRKQTQHTASDYWQTNLWIENLSTMFDWERATCSAIPVTPITEWASWSSQEHWRKMETTDMDSTCPELV